jgi:hypothetical protein
MKCILDGLNLHVRQLRVHWDTKMQANKHSNDLIPLLQVSLKSLEPILEILVFVSDVTIIIY